MISEHYSKLTSESRQDDLVDTHSSTLATQNITCVASIFKSGCMLLNTLLEQLDYQQAALMAGAMVIEFGAISGTHRTDDQAADNNSVEGTFWLLLIPTVLATVLNLQAQYAKDKESSALQKVKLLALLLGVEASLYTAAFALFEEITQYFSAWGSSKYANSVNHLSLTEQADWDANSYILYFGPAMLMAFVGFCASLNYQWASHSEEEQRASLVKILMIVFVGAAMTGTTMGLNTLSQSNTADHFLSYRPWVYAAAQAGNITVSEVTNQPGYEFDSHLSEYELWMNFGNINTCRESGDANGPFSGHVTQTATVFGAWLPILVNLQKQAYKDWQEKGGRCDQQASILFAFKTMGIMLLLMSAAFPAVFTAIGRVNANCHSQLAVLTGGTMGSLSALAVFVTIRLMFPKEQDFVNFCQNDIGRPVYDIYRSCAKTLTFQLPDADSAKIPLLSDSGLPEVESSMVALS